MLRKKSRHFNSLTDYLSCIQISRHTEFDPPCLRWLTNEPRLSRGRFLHIARLRVEAPTKRYRNNKMQHFWTQHVAGVCLPVATCCDMLGVIGSCLKLSNLSQQHSTCRNTSQQGSHSSEVIILFTQCWLGHNYRTKVNQLKVSGLKVWCWFSSLFEVFQSCLIILPLQKSETANLNSIFDHVSLTINFYELLYAPWVNYIPLALHYMGHLLTCINLAVKHNKFKTIAKTKLRELQTYVHFPGGTSIWKGLGYSWSPPWYCFDGVNIAGTKCLIYT